MPSVKLGGMVDTPDDCAANQRDLDMLEKWADGDLIKFNPGCKVLFLGRSNPVYQVHSGSGLAGKQLGRKRRWGPAEKLNTSQ